MSLILMFDVLILNHLIYLQVFQKSIYKIEYPNYLKILKNNYIYIYIITGKSIISVIFPLLEKSLNKS